MCFIIHHSSFIISPDDIAQHRTAPLTWPACARIVRAVLGPARHADHLRRNGPRQLAQTARHVAGALWHRPAALWPVADGPLSKTGAALAQRPRPRQAARPGQFWTLPVSLLAKQNAAGTIF